MMTRWLARGCGLIVLLLLLAGAPRDAAAECPADNQDYLGPCGPALALPPWGTGAWGAPEQYSTIQTADVDGDGAAELLGLGAIGLELHKLDLDKGLWLPVFDSSGLPVIERDFTDLPKDYTTIQTADLDGDRQAEVLGRDANGMYVLQYDPSTRAWKELAGHGPFADDDCFSNQKCWGDSPAYYSTIQTGDIDGDGHPELLGRGGDGIEAYSWTGSGWSQLPFDGILSDKDNWDHAEYYTTIQTADIDSDDKAELLGRYNDGMVTYSYSEKDGRWVLQSSSGPFSTHCGWYYPETYLTIQAADIDGDDRDELIGRSGDGMVAYQWTEDGWKQLGQEAEAGDLGCHKGGGPFPGRYLGPQYYSTIQTADLDGDNKAELLGRTKDGMVFYTWGDSGWSEISALKNSPQLEDTVDGLTLWEAASYYATIQTGDVDGNGKPELLARGVSGMRTWHLVDGKWAPYPTTATTKAPNGHGYPDPPFPTAGQVAAYKALGQYLNVPNDDVRTNGTNGYGNPGVSVNNGSGVWSGSLNTLQKNCGNNPINGLKPPQYANCTPPSGVDQKDWDTVVNAIIAELWYVTNSVNFYYLGSTGSTEITGLTQLASELFIDKQGELEAIVAAMEFNESLGKRAGINYGALTASMFKIMGAIGSAAGPEVGVPLSILGQVMGSIFGTGLPGGGASVTFEKNLTDAWADVVASGENAQDLPGLQFDFIRTDHTLLGLFGKWMTEQTDELALWRVNKDAYLSAARKGFATWVYQTFLPLLWDLFVITGCNNTPTLTCQPPPDDDYIAKYSSGGVNFTGLLPNDNSCTWFNNVRVCPFSSNVPDPKLVAKLWGNDNCSWSPKQHQIWHYGCPLGLPKGASSAIFNNRNGWKFRTVRGYPYFPPPAVAGRVPVELEGDGHLRATTTAPLPEDLDLSTATVLVDRLLHEDGGAGELARGVMGDPVDPDALRATRGRRGGAVFETLPGETPRMRLKLRQRRGRLEADLRVDRVIAQEPAFCAGLTPSTELWTAITIDDGFNPPLPLEAVTQWECRERPNGERELLAR